MQPTIFGVAIRMGINAFKLESLLNELGMKGQLLNSISEDELERVFGKHIDYSEIDEHVGRMAEKSGKYLESALEKAKNGERKQ